MQLLFSSSVRLKSSLVERKQVLKMLPTVMVFTRQSNFFEINKKCNTLIYQIRCADSQMCAYAKDRAQICVLGIVDVQHSSIFSDERSGGFDFMALSV